MKLTNYVPHAAQHILNYGPPKVGKTLLVGKLAGKPVSGAEGDNKINLLWFDLESGSNTLVYNLTTEEQECVELIKLPDTSGYPIAIETLLKVFTVQGVHNICEDHGKVACPLCMVGKKPFVAVELARLPRNTIVVIDSATQLAASAMNNITKGKNDDYKPDWDDYRKQGHLLTKIYSEIQQAPYHCVVISHEEMVETTDKTSKIVPTGGTRNFSKMFAKFFDHVVYQQVTAMQHKAGSSTTYLMNVITGSRSNVAVEKLEKGEEVSLLRMFQQPMKSQIQAALAQPRIMPALAGDTPAATTAVTPSVGNATPQPVPPGYKAVMVAGRQVLVKDPNAKPAEVSAATVEQSNSPGTTGEVQGSVSATSESATSTEHTAPAGNAQPIVEAAPAGATSQHAATTFGTATSTSQATKAPVDMKSVLDAPGTAVKVATVNPAYAALMQRVKDQNAAKAAAVAAKK